MHGHMTRYTVTCHDTRSHVTMHSHMSRYTATCHDAGSYERKKTLMNERIRSSGPQSRSDDLLSWTRTYVIFSTRSRQITNNPKGWTTTDSFRKDSASIYLFTNPITSYHPAININHKNTSLRSASNKQQSQCAQTVRRYLPVNTENWLNYANSVLGCYF